MDTKTAARLIEGIWDIQSRLKAISDDLTQLENAIADEVPDNNQ